jgi:hypothetical protein
MFDFESIRAGLERASNAANALAGQSGETITLRHNGIVLTVPYADNEGKTIRQVFAENTSRLAMSADSQPVVTTSAGNACPLDDEIEPGTYDAWTDKKENA